MFDFNCLCMHMMWYHASNWCFINFKLRWKMSKLSSTVSSVYQGWAREWLRWRKLRLPENPFNLCFQKLNKSHTWHIDTTFRISSIFFYYVCFRLECTLLYLCRCGWARTSAIKADGMQQIIHDSKCLHDIFLDKIHTINMLLYVVNKLISRG